MPILGKDVVHEFKFIALSKKGEYFFNRFIKTNNLIEVLKQDNIYTGYAKLNVLHNLCCRHLYKYGNLQIGKPCFEKTIIEV